MSRDTIRAALAEYELFASLAGNHAGATKAKEALRLFDEQAAPVDVEEWIHHNWVMFDTAKLERYVPVDDLLSLIAGKAIVPIKATLEMINAALPDAVRESDEDKYRAIGEIVCIWDAMLAASTTAAKREANDGQRSV